MTAAVQPIIIHTLTSPKTGKRPFEILYKLPKETNLVILIGGRGGAKTYEVSKFIAKSAAIDKKRCVILRDEKELIRESILNDILTRYDVANSNGQLATATERTETGIKDRRTGEMLVFTKGFRASDNQKKANLKGASNIDIAVVEEAEDIRDEDKFNTFHDSLRKEGAVIIIILNTPDLNHWVLKRYFNKDLAKDAVNADGVKVDDYFEISPKKIPGFLCIQTGYEDNGHLPQSVIDRYNAYGDPTSHLYNPFYYYTAIKGYASTGRKGQILTKVKRISLKDYMALPFTEIYGQDFGTASPAGFVGVKFNKNSCYCRQISYTPKNVLSIGKMYASMGLNSAHKIVADSAEPKTIERLKSGWKEDELDPNDFALYPQLRRGFHVVPAVKGVGSIKTGIALMTGLELYAVEESEDLWHEIQNWIYATDMSGMATDEPEDKFNHLIDPLRYVITDYKGLSKNFSQKGYFR